MTEFAVRQYALSFAAQTVHGAKQIDFTADNLVLAGWVGRDQESLEEHIRELEALGVPRPTRTPVFYRVAASLVTQATGIQVVGRDATGEAEVVLFRHEGETWVTIGSDHTDRKVESINITLSKQLCEKPLATSAWPLSECRGHWDQLILRSWIEVDGETLVYQNGAVSSMRLPWDLVTLYQGDENLSQDTLMFCGTLPVHGTIRWSDSFSAELYDPVLKRALRLRYRLEPLPIAD